LAHELTHALQQRALLPSNNLRIAGADSNNESQADAFAHGLSHATPISRLASPSTLQRQIEDSCNPNTESPREVAQDDGVTPEVARQALSDRIGEDRLREFERNALNLPSGPDAGAIPVVHPAIIVGAAVAAAFICASGFYHYALNHYGHKNDKWLHCYTSCKITSYCGGPAVALMLGAGKEVVDYMCERLGFPCGAEWEDFVADLEGIACAYSTSSCASCCDSARP
jgi:hypothetical protein